MSKYVFLITQAGLLIKIVHLLYYLNMCVSKLPCGTHTPRATGNESRNMQLEISEKECLTVVCL
jgi:hypothetical protein